MKKYYPDLPARHFLPFANYRDWGVLCFDANEPAPAYEYPVVLFEVFSRNES
jgi:hypothetical protein